MKLSIRVTVTVALVFLANVHTGGMTESTCIHGMNSRFSNFSGV